MTHRPAAAPGLPEHPDPHAAAPHPASHGPAGPPAPGQTPAPYPAGGPPVPGPATGPGRTATRPEPGAPVGAAPAPPAGRAGSEGAAAGGRKGARRPARPRRTRRIGNAVATLVIIALAAYLHTLVLTPDDLAARLTSSAAPGEVAETGRFSARLDRVEFARSIELQSTRVNAATGQEEVARSTRIETPHIFVIASVSATAPKEPTKLAEAGLETADELFFVATDRVERRFTLGETYIQPGFWSSGVLVFEVPPEVLPGSRVVLTVPSTNGIYDSIYPQRYDQLLPEVALDLGLDEAKAKSAVAAAKDVYRLKAAE